MVEFQVKKLMKRKRMVINRQHKQIKTKERILVSTKITRNLLNRIIHNHFLKKENIRTDL